MKKYTIRLTPHLTILVDANTPEQARQVVWNDIKDGYTYGYHSAIEIPLPFKCEPYDLLIEEKLADAIAEAKQIQRELREQL